MIVQDTCAIIQKQKQEQAAEVSVYFRFSLLHAGSKVYRGSNMCKLHLEPQNLNLHYYFIRFVQCTCIPVKQPESMMLPPPWLTVGTVFFGLKASPWLLQTYVLSLWPNSSICVSLTIKYSSRRYLARPCWQSHISLVLEGVDFFTRRFFLVSVILNISTNFLFPEGKSWGFLPDLGKVVTRLNNYVNNYDSLNRWSCRLKLFRNASERPAQLV